MSSRHRSREQALQILYLWDMRRASASPKVPDTGSDTDSGEFSILKAIEAYYGSLALDTNEEPPSAPDPFAEELVTGIVLKLDEIDRLILEHSNNWRLARMPSVDRNILRLAVYEMLYVSTPAPIVIDEALELAQRFSGDQSAAFINGVLDAIRQDKAP